MKSNQVYQWCRQLLHAGLGAPCRLCGCEAGAQALCDACVSALPVNRPACRLCARPCALDGAICGRCLRRPPPVGQVLALWRYAAPVDSLITALKYHAAFDLLPMLAAQLLQRIDAVYGDAARPDVLIPVPLHPKRQRQRGYNQAAEISRHLAGLAGIPWRLDSLLRLRDTPDQIGLTAAERRRNLRGAFAIGREPLPAHVALIDDVITTGATSLNAIRCLRKAGVQRVDVWCLARTVFQQGGPE